MNIWINFTSPETKMIVLPDTETTRSYLNSSGQNIGRTERQTDGQNHSSYYSAVHCEQCTQCRHAVKSLTEALAMCTGISNFRCHVYRQMSACVKLLTSRPCD